MKTNLFTYFALELVFHDSISYTPAPAVVLLYSLGVGIHSFYFMSELIFYVAPYCDIM